MKVLIIVKIEFHNKTFNDFKQSLGDLRSEMEARFNSKDEIINALSKVVKTLQDTLRHPNWSSDYCIISRYYKFLNVDWQEKVKQTT